MNRNIIYKYDLLNKQLIKKLAKLILYNRDESRLINIVIRTFYRIYFILL